MNRPILLRCNALFDGVFECVRKDWDILVRDGRIAEAGPNLSATGAAQVIDLRGFFVTPGLIDAHVHPEFFDWRTIYDQFATFTDEWLALGTLHTAQKALQSGFTTLRVLGSFSRGFGLVDVKRAIDEGHFAAARLYVSAHGLTVTGGHGDLSRTIPRNPAVSQLLQPGAAGSSPAFFAECVRREAKYGADYIKILASHDMAGEDGCDERLEFTDEELAAIFDTAHAMRLPVTAHAYSPPVIKKLVHMGIAGIEHGSLLDEETIALMIEKNVYLVPTLAPFDELLYGDENDPALPPATRRRIAQYRDRLAESRRLILESGLLLGYGSDFVSRHQSHEGWREYASWVRSGAAPLRALGAATSANAAILNAPGLGRIAPGIRADIAAWPANLLEDPDLLGRCLFVMKDGVVTKPAE